ncbi:hypothetical protein CSC3H3_01185 [Thalassospira marina]|uniref:CBS domain-containing protein n=2 Tax=Thalassospira marina TaxID=2048283 RepID=A0ABN5FKF4_9PROT|nr:hypothetical protein CSC3H3_01185 [Thalassospira marina]
MTLSSEATFIIRAFGLGILGIGISLGICKIGKKNSPLRSNPRHVLTKQNQQQTNSRFGWLPPVPVGSTFRNRLLAAFGALFGISLTGLICAEFIGQGLWAPLIVAPIGASAVLLFAVPSSPLAQPWAIIGGNTLSAAIGMAVAYFVDDAVLGIGLAVSFAIIVMSLTRCLHPPGGAAALTAVLGGKVVSSWGVLFPLLPVGVNSCLLVIIGVIFHKIIGHSYPHRSATSIEQAAHAHHTRDLPPHIRSSFIRSDITTVLERQDETFDIDPEDLETLVEEVALQARCRKDGQVTCQEIMSRDVIFVGREMSADIAISLLLHHKIRTLPVLDANETLLGTVGLRDLVYSNGKVGDYLSPAIVAAPDDLAFNLIPHFTTGDIHAVVIADRKMKIKGIISQTDILSNMFNMSLLK